MKEHPQEIQAAATEAQGISNYLVDRTRDVANREDKPVADGAAGDRDQSREPERAVAEEKLQYKMTGPGRFEYSQGQRSAVIEAKPNGGGHTLTTGGGSKANERARDCASMAAAVVAAREYLSTGRTPGVAPAQEKPGRADSREPHIEAKQTGPERWQYRHGPRTAVVEPPAPDKGLHRYRVTMETSDRSGSLTRLEKDSDQAQKFARQYAATGDVPTRSEYHQAPYGAGAKRSDPSPEKASSHQVERDDEPSR